MYSCTDCPYKGGAERTAEIVNRVYPLMKERGIDPRRLRLTAICTVCTKPFLKEVEEMNKLLEEIGPVSTTGSLALNSDFDELRSGIGVGQRILQKFVRIRPARPVICPHRIGIDVYRLCPGNAGNRPGDKKNGRDCYDYPSHNSSLISKSLHYQPPF